MKEDHTLITRLGDRSGTLRVEAHIYGIDVKICENDYGLTLDQAKTLQERLTKCIEDLEAYEENNYGQSR